MNIYKSKPYLIFVFIVILLISTSCKAWYSGEQLISRSGYNAGVVSESFEEDISYRGSSGCSQSNVTNVIVPNAENYARKRTAHGCPTWLCQYIIAPLRGALRTNFD